MAGAAELKAQLTSAMWAARRRGALWVRLADFVRLAATAQGRAALWTRLVHRGDVHQTTASTWEERYPALFDLAASLASDARRILSFGCSTGEELVSLRRRFPAAEIVGAEINPRSRRIARRRVASDGRISVVAPRSLEGRFDCIFALAVLQREPHKVEQLGMTDLSGHYPFAQFDAAVACLVAQLNEGGLLCVINAQYRVEDSSAASDLEPVRGSPATENPIFGRDGRRLPDRRASTVFRKRR